MGQVLEKGNHIVPGEERLSQGPAKKFVWLGRVSSGAGCHISCTERTRGNLARSVGLENKGEEFPFAVGGGSKATDNRAAILFLKGRLVS